MVGAWSLQVYRRDVITFACSSRAGELPLTIGQLKANGCKVELYGNKGFTLSHDIRSVANATKLDFSECYLGGALAGLSRYTAASSPLLAHRAQANSRSQSAYSRQTAARLISNTTRASRSRTISVRLSTPPSSTSGTATLEVRAPAFPVPQSVRNVQIYHAEAN